MPSVSLTFFLDARTYHTKDFTKVLNKTTNIMATPCNKLVIYLTAGVTAHSVSYLCLLVIECQYSYFSELHHVISSPWRTVKVSESNYRSSKMNTMFFPLLHTSRICTATVISDETAN